MNTFLFVLAAAGLTHIIVDSYVLSFFRDFVEKYCPEKINHLVNCHQCIGFWSGLIMGWQLMGWEWWFPCACAGSFLGIFTVYVFDYINSKTSPFHNFGGGCKGCADKKKEDSKDSTDSDK